MKLTDEGENYGIMDLPEDNEPRIIRIFSAVEEPSCHEIPRLRNLQNCSETKKEQPTIWKLLLVSMPQLPCEFALYMHRALLHSPLFDQMTPRAVQVARFASPMIGVLVAPAIGVISDQCTHRWGRRKPFIMYGAIATVLCLAALTTTSDLAVLISNDSSSEWETYLTLGFHIGLSISTNLIQFPMILMVADFSENRQTTGSVCITLWGYVGIILSLNFMPVAMDNSHLIHCIPLLWVSSTMLGVATLFFYFTNDVPLQDDEFTSTTIFKRIKYNIGSIYEGFATLPRQLMLYYLILFIALYGHATFVDTREGYLGKIIYSDYNGTKFDAIECERMASCTTEQINYLHGIHVSNVIEIITIIVGFLWTALLPLLIYEFGAKDILIVSMIPQGLLFVMANWKFVGFNIFVSIAEIIPISTICTLLVPISVHVLGERSDIGMYVGALNSAGFFALISEYLLCEFLGKSNETIDDTNEMDFLIPMCIAGVLGIIGIFICTYLRLEMHS